ncbi:MAG: bifunctional diaminohydroxyphosphoribosylaminopyrimidine deaminase/5-amino-6-(5-phosphoribosylamino)uracil reductase RibD [Deltaproteobacteria bacterium]|nr:bifunctional diaminohydroxyphosphoribosylaminopyrimidine deaminase/5-amino-6-(5-phosphoribosylamino)uracil reductase RibD [Deltaproteobacteria bacterium]
MKNFSNADSGFMQEALVLARKGRGLTSPNPMVGAVVVAEGEIVGRGYHPRAGEPHAEIFALREAGDRALNAELFVTLEPCNHQGRTPPCTRAIINAGISRVVIGTSDPNPQVAGRGAACLEQAGIRVESGLLDQECCQLNEFWNKYITTGLPFVTLKSAASLDGRIATHSGNSQWISNEKSRLYVHQLRASHDAILIGIGTLLKDNPRLTARRPGENPRNPYRIVVDSLLRTPLNSQIFGTDGAEKMLLATRRQSEEKLAPYRALVKEILILPTNPLGQIDLGQLMRELGQREITSVLIEGGSEINGSALDSQIIDKICFFYAPILIGGRGSLGMISGEGCETVAQALPVKDITIRHFDSDLCLEGYIEREN